MFLNTKNKVQIYLLQMHYIAKILSFSDFIAWNLEEAYLRCPYRQGVPKTAMVA